ncbi:hypothetical protein GF312_16855 [Candidatus Poribacteria bacterium]|nr:hypothetical protein [Candidatus Poribacteria bacterium]
MSEQVKEHNSKIRLIPYIIFSVSFLGWEIIKRTPVFISATISQQALRIYGLFSGIILLIFTAFLFGRFCLKGKHIFRFYPFDKYIIILLLLDFTALMVGLIRRNDMIFLIGDTYKFLVIPLAYFCTTQSLKSKDAVKLFLFIIILETVTTMGSFAYYLLRLVSGSYQRSPIHSISVLAFVFFMVSLTSKKSISYLFLTVVIGITALLSGARTLWIQLLLCPLVIFLVMRKIVIVKVLFRQAFVVMLITALISLAYGHILKDIAGEVTYRITKTMNLLETDQSINPTISSDRRVVEVKASLGTMFDSPNILNVLLGFGNGAEFYAPSAALGMGSAPGYKHHIHNGYVSLLFRMGLIGLLIFLIFSFSIINSISKKISSPVALHPLSFNVATSILVYFMLTLIEFLTIYNLIGEIKWGILLGIFRVIADGSISHENSY